MATVTIDFSQTQGPIKPLNGVNSGPRTKVFTYDATDLYREAHIAYSRMHDVEYPYGSGEFVDIHCIFPNFDADVKDPASYKFALTDRYIQAAREAGAGILYRLGESIEHAPVVQYVLPPKDFQKWAEICEHIIRHYNEGWADGFHWDISYWEIWNEADLDELAPKKKTWGGTKEAFFDLYAITATHLKKCFPALKIGGPALAYNLTWADEFLTALQNRQIPWISSPGTAIPGPPKAMPKRPKPCKACWQNTVIPRQKSSWTSGTMWKAGAGRLAPSASLSDPPSPPILRATWSKNGAGCGK